jgi:CheY-like chemotaxis protein
MERNTSSRRRVLLVEDEVLVSALAVDILDELSFDVVETGSAKAALAAAGNGDCFDVAIIDVGLPDQRGDEIATGYGTNSLDKRLKDTKRLVVITKPYDTGSLMGALNKLGLR